MNEVQYFDGDEYRVAYLWSHTPPTKPLVVLHGLGDSAIHTYAPRFATSVLKHTPTLFIDLPGFGESQAQDSFPGTIEAMAGAVHKLLESLGIKKAQIFAHSMGANVAIVLGTDYDHIYDSMVLAEPLLMAEDSVLASSIVRFSEQRFMERGFAMLQRATSLQANRGDAAAKAFLPVLSMANPRSVHRAAVSLLAERKPTFLAKLHQLSPTPVLLAGARTESEVIVNLNQEIRLIRVPEAGHNMMVEAEYATTCAILDIVNGIDHD